MTIPVTTFGHIIVAIMAILTILAISARLDMAMDMVIVVVYAKSRKNEPMNVTFYLRYVPAF